MPGLGQAEGAENPAGKVEFNKLQRLSLRASRKEEAPSSQLDQWRCGMGPRISQPRNETFFKP